jgi:hypothetical protein
VRPNSFFLTDRKVVPVFSLLSYRATHGRNGAAFCKMGGEGDTSQASEEFLRDPPPIASPNLKWAGWSGSKKRSAHLLTDWQALPFVHLKIRKIWFRFGQKGLDPMLELGIRPQFFEGLAFELQAHAQRSFVG